MLAVLLQDVLSGNKFTEHICWLFIFESNKNSFDLIILPPTTFPHSLSYNWGIYYIVGRNLLFPVDKSPCIFHQQSCQNCSLFARSSFKFEAPPRFCFSSGKTHNRTGEEFPWYSHNQRRLLQLGNYTSSRFIPLKSEMWKVNCSFQIRCIKMSYAETFSMFWQDFQTSFSRFTPASQNTGTVLTYCVSELPKHNLLITDRQRKHKDKSENTSTALD
jgi:hypothetical protein